MSSILQLSPELIESIASYLQLRDQLNMRKSCKSFKEPADSAILRNSFPFCLNSLSIIKHPLMAPDEIDVEFSIPAVKTQKGITAYSYTKAALMVSLKRFCGPDYEINGISFEVKSCTRKFLDNLMLWKTGLKVNSVNLNFSIPTLIPMLTKLFERAKIAKLSINLNDDVTSASCGLVLNFVNLVDSDCVRITSNQSTQSYHLLSRLADTKNHIIAESCGNHYSSDDGNVVDLVLDMLTAKCQYLELANALLITEQEARIIHNHIRSLGLKVFFSAAVKTKRETHPSPFDREDTIFLIRSTFDDELKIAEIYERGMRLPVREY